MSGSIRGLAAALLLAGACNAIPGPALAQSGQFDARFDAARALALAGRREQAIAAYTALLAESPGNADVLLGRGRVYAWQGEWPRAESDLRAATAAAPDYADAWSALGDLYLWSDRPAQAAEAYARWQALAPASEAAAQALARARAATVPAGPVGGKIEGTGDVDDGDDGTDPRYRWSAGLGASLTGTSDAGTWQASSASLRRRFERGSLALEVLQARRFSRDDQAYALDAYVDVWARGYANLRYQWSGGDGLYPAHAWRAELFQGFGRGWEASASYDHLGFSGGATRIEGIGLGRYWGNFYARARWTRVPGASGDSNSLRGLLRWYYRGNADDYLQLAGGSGRGAAELAGRGPGTPLGSRAASIDWVRWFGPRWGLRLGAGYVEDDALDRIEREASLGVTWRW